MEASDWTSWRRLLCDSFVPQDIEPIVRDPYFAGRIDSILRDCMRVDRVDVRADPHVVRRRPPYADDDQIMALVQLDGTSVVQQADREAVLRPSDLAIFDGGVPYDLAFPQGDHAVAVLQIPRDLIEPAVPGLASCVAVRIPGGAGLATAVSPFLASLHEALFDAGNIEGERLARHAFDLLVLVANAYTDSSGTLEGRARHLLRAQAFINDHASDPDLAPAAVAAAAYVSVGYLHRLFQETGTTVREAILLKRLARCREDLADPSQRGVTITQIAHRHGFKDGAHFTRTFRRRYGMPPLQWRHQAPKSTQAPPHTHDPQELSLTSHAG
jgi:AraC-like DNA-binding protein